MSNGVLNTGIVRPKPLAADPSITDPGSVYYNTTNNELRFYKFGSGWTSLATAGANTSLSNLTSTSINQSLLFDSDLTYDIGDFTNRPANVWSSFISATDSIGLRDTSGNPIFTASVAGPILGLYTGPFFSSPTDFSTYNAFGFRGRNNTGTGDSHDLVMLTGGASEGKSGNILIQVGSVEENYDSGDITLSTSTTSGTGSGGNIFLNANALGSIISLSASSDIQLGHGTGKSIFVKGDNFGLFFQNTTQPFFSGTVDAVIGMANFQNKTNLGISGGNDSPTVSAGSVTIGGGYAAEDNGSGGSIFIESGDSNNGPGGNISINANGGIGANRGNITLSSRSLNINADNGVIINPGTLLNINKQVWLTDNSSMIFFNADNSQSTELKAKSSAVGSPTFYLPDADGVSGFSLSTDGFGGLSFTSPNSIRQEFPSLDGVDINLTNSSARQQNCGGGTADTNFIMPDTATIELWTTFRFVNKSSFNLTVKNFSGTTIYTIPINTISEFSWTGGSWNGHSYAITGTFSV